MKKKTVREVEVRNEKLYNMAKKGIKIAKIVAYAVSLALVVAGVYMLTQPGVELAGIILLATGLALAVIAKIEIKELR